MKGEYIKFVDMTDEPDAKTKTIKVVSVREGYTLGVIKWHGAWRRYTFFPDGDTVWSDESLQEIEEKIQELMRQWNLKKIRSR